MSETEPETTRPEASRAQATRPTKTKTFTHFADPSVVPVLLDELRARHGCSAEALAERIVVQMRDWFAREFPPARTGASSSAPTRFAGHSDP